MSGPRLVNILKKREAILVPWVKIAVRAMRKDHKLGPRGGHIPMISVQSNAVLSQGGDHKMTRLLEMKEKSVTSVFKKKPP